MQILYYDFYTSRVTFVNTFGILKRFYFLPFRIKFGFEIWCKTGKYRGQKVPAERLTVAVKYGTNTTKEIPSAYQYAENPKITDFKPKSSFLW